MTNIRILLLSLVICSLAACATSPQVIAKTEATWTQVPTQTPYSTYTPSPAPTSTVTLPISSPTSVATVTVSPQDFVKIVPDSVSCSRSNNYWTINGTVENTSSDYDLRYVELRGTIKKDDGTIINTNKGYTDSLVLARNATSKFTILVLDPNKAGAKCEVTIVDARIK